MQTYAWFTTFNRVSECIFLSSTMALHHITTGKRQRERSIQKGWRSSFTRWAWHRRLTERPSYGSSGQTGEKDVSLSPSLGERFAMTFVLCLRNIRMQSGYVNKSRCYFHPDSQWVRHLKRKTKCFVFLCLWWVKLTFAAKLLKFVDRSVEVPFSPLAAACVKSLTWSSDVEAKGS